MGLAPPITLPLVIIIKQEGVYLLLPLFVARLSVEKVLEDPRSTVHGMQGKGLQGVNPLQENVKAQAQKPNQLVGISALPLPDSLVRAHTTKKVISRSKVAEAVSFFFVKHPPLSWRQTCNPVRAHALE